MFQQINIYPCALYIVVCCWCPLKKISVFFSATFFFLKDTWCYKEEQKYNLKDIKGDLAFA